MKISIIAAMGDNRVIGIDNQLPWHLPADLARFKQLTVNKPIIMGRKTYESIGRPLPKRQNIVISRNPEFQAEGCLVVKSLPEAVNLCQSEQAEEVFIIGGASLYEEAISSTEVPASTMYLTRVKTKPSQGDSLVFFPNWEESEWEKREETVYLKDNDKHAYDMHFLTYERKPS